MFSNLFRKPEKKGKGKADARSGSRPKTGGGSARGAARGGSGRAPRSRGQQPLPPAGLSLDRKLDILGILLVFVGLTTGLSLFATQSDIAVLRVWLNLNRQLAGWGVFGLPVAFLGVGLWLILRNFGDRLPKLEPERVIGIVLLYLALLTTFHFMVAETTATVYDPVPTGQGGGLIGAILLLGLLTALGTLGSAVFLGAWWIIGLVFAAGLSVPELVLLVAGWLRRARGVERQLPLPRLGDSARAGPPDSAGASAASARPAQRPAGPGARAAPEPVPGAVPAPASLPGPSYDQPLVIGGDQPWELPALADMLDPGTESGASDELDRQRANLIEATLASFGAPVRVVEVNRGPTITQFGVEPDFVEQRGGKKTKVKVGKIASLADDLALALSAHSIRIEAPVPGKGYVGIEVPNAETSLVALRDVMESDTFDQLKGALRLGLGQDVSGNAISARLDSMPHLLIAGTTGSGKSVCVNSVIACLLIQNTPDDLKFVMVDPKRVELTGYNGIPHLLSPVVVELERVVASLQWVTREMDERYRKFAKVGVRNIADYNARAAAANEKKLFYLVVIIDELADLMMLAPDETERTLTRLAQLARATGIHLVIATQRPSVDVVTGLIKANFPARIAFAVASGVDSRVILDQPGAERLLGRGDMLFQSPDAAAPLRMQGVFVSDAEIQRLVRYWKGARGVEMAAPADTAAPGAPSLPSPSAAGATNLAGAPPMRQQPLWDGMVSGDVETRPDGEDELLEEAIQAVREMKKASISLLQRRLRIGYTRAARLIDVLEEKGIIGPAESGAKPREVIDFGATPPEPGAAPGPSTGKRTWTSE
ncbi:MAG: DNA translocase FtsK 4TM domain-containing protein [Anaerolineales bacterium]|nr:DNA translocase FtsK 4TM domain-containing protein [Anaerolineales bacterium]